MTTPSPPSRPLPLDPGWTDDQPSAYGPSWQRYVLGKGILKVTSTSGTAVGYDWHLTVTGTEAIAWSPRRLTTPLGAMRAADRAAAHMPPGPFEPITSPDDAIRLYMTLERARDLGYAPGAGNWDLGQARGELLTHIRILALDQRYHGPSPDQVIREAVLWWAAAARTGLRESDFDPALLGADGWERNHLRSAAVFLLAGDYSQASAELDLATTVAAPGSDVEARLGRLQTRLDEAAAGSRAEDPSRTSMTEITTRRLRQELRGLGLPPGRIEELIETAPYTEARQGWASGADFTLTAVGSAAGPRRWDLLIRPYGTGQDTPADPGLLPARAAGEATPAVNIITSQYAVVVDRSPQNGTVQVRHPDGSHGWGNASAFVPAVTVLDPALHTAIELARDLGIAPPAGPSRLRPGSPYTAWSAIVRAAGLHMASPATQAAEAAAYKATGKDPAYSQLNSVPWARAAWQALQRELSTPGPREITPRDRFSRPCLARPGCTRPGAGTGPICHAATGGRAGIPRRSGRPAARQPRQATSGYHPLTRHAGPSGEATVTALPPTGPGRNRHRPQPGCRGRYRELREVPATDQAIRAVGTALPGWRERGTPPLPSQSVQ